MGKKSTLTSTKTSTITNTMVAVAVLILGSASLVAAAALTYFPKQSGKTQLAANGGPSGPLPLTAAGHPLLKEIKINVNGTNGQKYVANKKDMNKDDGSVHVETQKNIKTKTISLTALVEKTVPNISYGFYESNTSPYAISDSDKYLKNVIAQKTVWSKHRSYTFEPKYSTATIFVFVKGNDEIYNFPNLKIDDVMEVTISAPTSTTP